MTDVGADYTKCNISSKIRKKQLLSILENMYGKNLTELCSVGLKFNHLQNQKTLPSLPKGLFSGVTEKSVEWSWRYKFKLATFSKSRQQQKVLRDRNVKPYNFIVLRKM